MGAHQGAARQWCCTVELWSLHSAGPEKGPGLVKETSLKNWGVQGIRQVPMARFLQSAQSPRQQAVVI